MFGQIFRVQNIANLVKWNTLDSSENQKPAKKEAAILPNRQMKMKVTMCLMTHSTKNGWKKL